ncbi:hypothetical protein BC830DRAFT_710626 [Chytriomyces sp. MP71]|nr:hypothetical protein BC830DRAFT_710626 [Chytriomyces sp. MP71]
MYRIPSMTQRCGLIRHLKLQLDDTIGIGMSKALPIAFVIIVFIHYNACSTYYVGKMSGFSSWATMIPGYATATLFETYTWVLFLVYFFIIF